jgi:hypothetical protein
VLNSLVNDKVRGEQPGILRDIAVGVLNLAALLLAPETGGLSLAVAAGVNVAVTASHVEDYLTKKALAGTAFDRTRALSRDDPSLFWLAFEIVGTGLDIGTAAIGIFKTLGPLAEAAIAAKEGKEAEESLAALENAARDAEKVKGPGFAVRRASGRESASRAGRQSLHQGLRGGEQASRGG